MSDLINNYLLLFLSLITVLTAFAIIYVLTKQIWIKDWREKNKSEAGAAFTLLWLLGIGWLLSVIPYNLQTAVSVTGASVAEGKNLGLIFKLLFVFLTNTVFVSMLSFSLAVVGAQTFYEVSRLKLNQAIEDNKYDYLALVCGFLLLFSLVLKEPLSQINEAFIPFPGVGYR
jgi:hypothetical protein